MLQLNSHNVNFNGESIINVNDEKVAVANMQVSYSGDNVYVSLNILDIENYMDNKDIVDADFISFKDKALNTVSSM